eukprot:243032_1
MHRLLHFHSHLCLVLTRPTIMPAAAAVAAASTTTDHKQQWRPSKTLLKTNTKSIYYKTATVTPKTVTTRVTIAAVSSTPTTTATKITPTNNTTFSDSPTISAGGPSSYPLPPLPPP